ncbi:MAG: hypothetical protein SGILL_006666, partial [Bacillariaceae sp.]
CPLPRRNHIVVSFHGSAGLGDRFTVLDHLSNIAGYLCANLHVPSPSVGLATKHNLGVSVLQKVEWSDFRNGTWIVPDRLGQPVHNTLYALPRSENAFVIVPELWPSPLYNMKGILSNPKLRHKRTWYSTMEISPVPRHHLVAPDDTAATQIPQLIDILEEQLKQLGQGANESEIDSFLWEIPQYEWHLGIFNDQIRVAMSDRNQSIPPSFPENLPPGVAGCQYSAWESSAHVQEVVRRVWDEVQDRSSTVGVLHLRRGDTLDSLDSCNTSIPVLHDYFNCTFANTTKYGNITMLLATDETDPHYISEVKMLLEGMYPHVRLVHLDPIVEIHAQAYAEELIRSGSQADFAANNFFTFEVGNVLKTKRAAFLISRRRTMACNACDRLSSWTWVKWVGMNRT